MQLGAALVLCAGAEGRAEHAGERAGEGVTRASRADSAVVVLLGTGMPRPNPEASGPATALVVGDRLFLFDAGPGVMRQLAAAGLSIKGPTAVFVSHLHSDHTLGLPDLILTSWVMGRNRVLPLYGPRGLREMTDHITAAWREDIDIRTNGLEHDPPNGWRVAVRTLVAGVAYDSAGVRISAIPVEHGSWKEAYGFLIEAMGRRIVISGDTRASAALERAARGAELLIHEGYPETRLKPEDRPGGEQWPAYMRSFHTSDVEIGQLARRAGVATVVLHHLVRMGGTDEELIAGVRRGGFTGRVVVGKDLQRF